MLNADEIKFDRANGDCQFLLYDNQIYKSVEGRWYEVEWSDDAGQYVLTKESRKCLALARHRTTAFLIVGATLMGCLLAVLIYSMR